MKLFNILKKETKNSTSVNVQSLSKNQLEKVIGGTDETIITLTTTDTIVKGTGKSSTGATASGS
jgi:hypothetical protein